MNQDINLNIDQRSIKISDFIAARATEVSSFTHLLKNKLASLNKLPFQLLPKHMRRRAMSHNKYRIPTRVRERVKEEDLLLKKPSRCRHSLRKTRFLLSSYARRNQTARWLETHIWHAKRMKMKEYFGYNVAETCRAKSGRAAYKYFKTDSLLYDLSYNFIFEIKTATKQTTIQFLAPFVDTSSNEWKQFCNNKDIEKGGKKGYLTLWNNNPRKLIQRCEYIIRPTIGSNTEFQIWFLLHPSSKAGLELILRDPSVNFEGIKYKCYEANFNVFHLIGPRACNKVYWLLQNISNSKQEFERIENNPLIKAMKFIEDPGVFPRNFVLHISLEKRHNGKLLNAPKNILNRQEQSSLDAQEQINEFTIELASYRYNPSSDAPSFDLWEAPEIPGNDENSLRYKNITRGRFTHKKGNYLKAMEEERQKKAAKAKPKSGKKAKGDKNIEIETEEVHVEEEKVPEDLKPFLEENPVEPPVVVESKKIEIIIMHEEGDSQTCEGSGLKIIVPCGQGLYIWRYLNYLGCKALGMQEYHQVLNERRDFIFPQDFPSSNSYQLFQQNSKEEKITKYFKKPPAKRINLMKIGSPFAFASDWATLISRNNLTEIPISESITPVYVRMIRSRYPVNLATLSIPTIQDFERIKESEKNPKGGLDIVATEPLGKSEFGKPLKKVTSQEYIEKLVQVQTSRQLGGFITTGYLSYRFGAGCGKGYILKSLLNDLKPFEVPQNVFRDHFEISLSYSSVYYMLIKNPSSRFYYACKVYVLKP